MSEVIEETQAGRRATSKVAGVASKAALVGMSMMGSSVAHTEPHADHGYAPARWTAAAISIVGWLVGGIAFPFRIWALVVAGGVLQVVAVIVNLAMNAAGMGAGPTTTGPPPRRRRDRGQRRLLRPVPPPDPAGRPGSEHSVNRAVTGADACSKASRRVRDMDLGSVRRAGPITWQGKTAPCVAWDLRGR